DGCLARDGEGCGVGAVRRGEPIEIVEECLQLRGRQGHRRVGAHWMPAVAELGRPAQRRLAVAAHPDRRVWLLYGLRLTAERIEPVEPAGERRRALGP